jgi:UDP-N-acetylglucosamine acyltransferase
MAPLIHPTAVVNQAAELDDGVEIGPYCIVDDHVHIGAGTKLNAFVHIKPYVRLGVNNEVHSYACIGGEPQSLSFKGEETWVEIGDNNTIREYVTINRGTGESRGTTSIGNDVMLMAYVHVAHDSVLHDGVIMANNSGMAGHVEIGTKAIVGPYSGMQQFVRVGEYTFLAGMSGFRNDVPPYSMASGSRARLHGLNRIGLRRNGFSKETISALRQAYTVILRSDLIREEALTEAEETLGEVPEVARFIEFFRTSKVGVTPDGPAEK